MLGIRVSSGKGGKPIFHGIEDVGNAAMAQCLFESSRPGGIAGAGCGDSSTCRWRGGGGFLGLAGAQGVEDAPFAGVAAQGRESRRRREMPS